MTDREYKAAGAKDVDSIRRTKKQESVQLRKQKREERLLEKRATLTHLTPETKIKYPPPSIEDLPQLAQQVYSEDLNVLQYSTTQIRRLLSSSKTVPPLKKVIDTGIIPRLVQLMNSDDEILRIETAWTLTNIASGTQEQTRCVVDANSIPIFIKLLYDSNLKVAEQAMWALGNIAGDCPELRDLTMNHGILEPLMVHLSTALTNYEQVASHEGIESDEDFKANVTLMRTFTWTLSNLCRGKNPSADLQRLLPALPLLARFLQLVHAGDKATIADACWAWTFISDLERGIEAVLEHGVAPRLVQLLSYPSKDIVSPVLRTVGNILGGDEIQTQRLIDYGCLSHLHSLIESNEQSVRKDACWALSNITAGTFEQVLSAVQANVVPGLVRCLRDEDHRVRKEAGEPSAWAVSNAAHVNNSPSPQSQEIIAYFVEQGAIGGLLTVLEDHPDPKTTCVIFLGEQVDSLLSTWRIPICIFRAGLKKFLQAGTRLNTPDGQNPYALTFEENNGVQILNKIMQQTQNAKVADGCQDLLKFFEVEHEEEALAPQQAREGYGCMSFLFLFLFYYLLPDIVFRALPTWAASTFNELVMSVGGKGSYKSNSSETSLVFKNSEETEVFEPNIVYIKEVKIIREDELISINSSFNESTKSKLSQDSFKVDLLTRRKVRKSLNHIRKERILSQRILQPENHEQEFKTYIKTFNHNHLNPDEGTQYFLPIEDIVGATKVAVVITFYNEEKLELKRTLASLYAQEKESAYMYRNAKNEKNNSLEFYYLAVMDGYYEASNSMIEYISEIFGDEFDENFGPYDKDDCTKIVSKITKTGYMGSVNISPGKTLKLAVIIKKQNRKKLNSHEWFFKAFLPHCNARYAFTTDCGTLFGKLCLYRLLNYLEENEQVAAVTGRQRVMSLEMQGFKAEGLQAMWYRAAQAYDYEASISAFQGAFSLCGMLPVLPGPCAMFRCSDIHGECLNYYINFVKKEKDKNGLVSGNVMLAEDRILSFAASLMTGKYTQWPIMGALPLAQAERVLIKYQNS
ncbi:hypothetical protein Zmor_011997 [Zophobas morio]|uniref:IBB domain-containing protein n=1 Tax=Zophobas morio TaxID=2755281 RepID=A0AA38HLA6_9CUCU|nr:hypothetical protein Zmor_011997 [Zophobas morio]